MVECLTAIPVAKLTRATSNSVYTASPSSHGLDLPGEMRACADSSYASGPQQDLCRLLSSLCLLSAGWDPLSPDLLSHVLPF